MGKRCFCLLFKLVFILDLTTEQDIVIPFSICVSFGVSSYTQQQQIKNKNMPRPRNKLLYGLFKCNSLNQIVCYNNGCGGKPLYKHNASLERHLRLMHPLIHSWYMQKKKTLNMTPPRRLRLEKDIIDLMRSYPMLWSNSDANSVNEDLTNKAWKEISERTKSTVHMCKKKWEYLVEKYRSELDKMNQETADKGSSAQQWKSSWKYFTELSFLNDENNIASKNDVTACIFPQPIDIISIKEESSESFPIFNEILEDSNHCEDKKEDGREEFRLMIAEAEELRPQDNNNSRESSNPPDDSQMPKIQNDTQISTMENSNVKSTDTQISTMENSNVESTAAHDETDNGQEEDDCTVEKPMKVKRKKRKMLSESEDEDGNEPDTDRMFLLSLLPFLRAIPNENKLFVRHKMQGVLLDEQQKSKNV